MILVCGGRQRTENQDHEDPVYPTVIAFTDDEASAEHLQGLLSMVIDPFVVRLLDKDFAKIVNSEAGQKALKNG